MTSFSQSLDNYITGANDPNAPFNQVHWVETYDDILEKCGWISEEMIDDDNTCEKLGEIIIDCFEEVRNKAIGEKYLTSKEWFKFQKAHAKEIAELAKQRWDKFIIEKMNEPSAEQVAKDFCVDFAMEINTERLGDKKDTTKAVNEFWNTRQQKIKKKSGNKK